MIADAPVLLATFTLAKSCLYFTFTLAKLAKRESQQRNGSVPLPLVHFLTLSPTRQQPLTCLLGEERREEDFCQLPKMKLSGEADRKSEIAPAHPDGFACS